MTQNVSQYLYTTTRVLIQAKTGGGTLNRDVCVEVSFNYSTFDLVRLHYLPNERQKWKFCSNIFFVKGCNVFNFKTQSSPKLYKKMF